MSSDYHDVPHCIRQALAASPAPTHYSRISESPSHDELPSGPQGAKVTRGDSRKQFCPVLGKLNAETVSKIQLLSKLCHGTNTNRFSHLKKKITGVHRCISVENWMWASVEHHGTVAVAVKCSSGCFNNQKDRLGVLVE